MASTAMALTPARRIVVAILRGDRERAADAMRSHILTVREAYEVYAELI